jgi:hypothetical protein
MLVQRYVEWRERGREETDVGQRARCPTDQHTAKRERSSTHTNNEEMVSNVVRGPAVCASVQHRPPLQTPKSGGRYN